MLDLSHAPKDARIQSSALGGWAVVNADCLSDPSKQNLDYPSDADLFFSDPPYNFGLDYGDEFDDSVSRHLYRGWLDRLIFAGAARLMPGGAFWILLPAEHAAHAFVYLEKADLLFRNWVVWHETFGVQTSRKFARCSRHLLYFVKQHPASARAGAGKAPAAYFDPTHIKVQSVRQMIGDKRAKPGGKIPGDVWEIPRVAGTHAERCKEVPTQLPEELLRRVVLSTCPPAGKVLEFCAGSGSLGRVCVENGRAYEGWEISPVFADVAARRIREREMELFEGKK